MKILGHLYAKFDCYVICFGLSFSGWLSPQDDPLGYVSRIDQRIGDVTGLDMSTAEQLQVQCTYVHVLTKTCHYIIQNILI